MVAIELTRIRLERAEDRSVATSVTKLDDRWSSTSFIRLIFAVMVLTQCWSSMPKLPCCSDWDSSAKAARAGPSSTSTASSAV